MERDNSMADYYPPKAVQKPKSIPARLALQIAPPLVLGLVFAGLYAWARTGLEDYRRFLMPGLGELWEGAFGLPSVRTDLLRAAIVTGKIALAGLSLSIPIGMLLGVLMFRSRIVERAAFPYLVALQSIPILALIPLLQAILGFGFAPKVLIVTLFTFFAIPTTLLVGLKGLDNGVIDLFHLQGANWVTMLLKAGLPAAMPALFAGFRISASLAVIAAIVSELFFVSGDGGLGQMLINAKIDFQYEQMYAALIVSAGMSIGVYAFFSWLGQRLFSNWHDSNSTGAK